MTPADNAGRRDDLEAIRDSEDLESLEDARYAACAAIRERAKKDIAKVNAAYRRERDRLRCAVALARIVSPGEG